MPTVNYTQFGDLIWVRGNENVLSRIYPGLKLGGRTVARGD